MIVGGFGVPHTPHYPSIVAGGGPGAEEIVALYGEVRTRLEAAEPDVIVFLTSDHYNLFWETCIPIFSIAVAPSAWGASDYDTIPRRELTIACNLAVHVQRHLVRGGFDVGKSQELELDHTIVAPMHSSRRTSTSRSSRCSSARSSRRCPRPHAATRSDARCAWRWTTPTRAASRS